MILLQVQREADYQQPEALAGWVAAKTRDWSNNRFRPPPTL
jgi:hypothetical protein